ncbi:hypothetical protein T11_18579 [Trichinella zimbabwensis]|uniref:Uncharacterized protein n=1 Tax=Trichinella zimbabwensis TaxID=268475 RepID=A0A0V1GGZ6_9BILA|nr:hypothetical protein T11_18579 [Trichinella zimbabwensis]
MVTRLRNQANFLNWPSMIRSPDAEPGQEKI